MRTSQGHGPGVGLLALRDSRGRRQRVSRTQKRPGGSSGGEGRPGDCGVRDYDGGHHSIPGERAGSTKDSPLYRQGARAGQASLLPVQEPLLLHSQKPHFVRGTPSSPQGVNYHWSQLLMASSFPSGSYSFSQPVWKLEVGMDYGWSQKDVCIKLALLWGKLSHLH